jgi:predicted nucleotidyltransferase
LGFITGLCAAGSPSTDMFEWAAIQVKVTYRMDSSFVTVSMIDHVNLKDNLLASKFSSITKTKKIFKSKVFEEVQKQLNSKTHGQCLSYRASQVLANPQHAGHHVA